ncbi:uncharacterized protein BKA78DRAFT_81428 [Phyllosticta capitalensis]|uniref:uncharacterized protein n=1 Tax=Phyllosticta capitalensis TaxID=121624 RepID=UPI00312E799B
MDMRLFTLLSFLLLIYTKSDGWTTWQALPVLGSTWAAFFSFSHHLRTSHLSLHGLLRFLGCVGKLPGRAVIISLFMHRFSSSAVLSLFCFAAGGINQISPIHAITPTSACFSTQPQTLITSSALQDIHSDHPSSTIYHFSLKALEASFASKLPSREPDVSTLFTAMREACLDSPSSRLLLRLDTPHSSKKSGVERRRVPGTADTDGGETRGVKSAEKRGAGSACFWQETFK